MVGPMTSLLPAVGVEYSTAVIAPLLLVWKVSLNRGVPFSSGLLPPKRATTICSVLGVLPV